MPGWTCQRRCRLAALLGCAVLAGCAVPAETAVMAPVADAAANTEFARFDKLVTPQAVFPDAAQRGLYRMLPPVTENGQRSYTFQLQAQPGLDATRYFQLVTITWARGGQLLKSSGAGLSGTGGPGGGFVDALAQTDDRAYDVRVTLGSRLPDSVRVPAFDITKTAADMVRLYKAQ